MSFIVKQLKRLVFSLHEKQAPAVDDFGLEHFLTYHGLIGTAPDRQPDVLSIRADVMEALAQKDGTNLAIALKLPPLWWQDKLSSIISELKTTDREQAVSLLLLGDQQSGAIDSGKEPLKHPDWRVRANAAHLLADLEARHATDAIEQCLLECTGEDLRPAFCHIAYSLGRLQTASAKKLLAQFLSHEEPWFRVDAAKALSLWPFDSVAVSLSYGILQHHNLSDYQAVAIASQFKPSFFLHHDQQMAQEAGLELIINLTEAAAQTFSPDIVLATNCYLCAPDLFASLSKLSSACQVRASFAMASWIESSLSQSIANSDLSYDLLLPNMTDKDLIEQAKTVLHYLKEQPVVNFLLEQLTNLNSANNNETRHTVWLLGKLNVQQAAAKLVTLITKNSLCLAELIESLGQLGDKQATKPLIQLAHETVSMPKRCLYPASAQPIQEEDSVAARHYWLILKALGNLKDPQALEFLLKATEDFAPDKRAQALESLIETAQSCPLDHKTLASIERAIQKALLDPYLPTRLAALHGIGQLSLTNLLPELLNALYGKEFSLKEKSRTALAQLSASGHKAKVVSVVSQKLKSTFSAYQKAELEDLLDKL